MGMLSDFYIADDEQRALEYDSVPESFASQAFVAQGISSLELSMLWCLLLGEEWNEQRFEEFPELFLSDSGDRWIFRLPDEFIAVLAALSPEREKEAAVLWANTEELACAPDDILPVVSGLKGIAQQSVATKQPVFLWMSL